MTCKSWDILPIKAWLRTKWKIRTCPYRVELKDHHYSKHYKHDYKYDHGKNKYDPILSGKYGGIVQKDFIRLYSLFEQINS